MAETGSPSPRELRNFGLLLGTLFAAFFAVLPALLRHHVPLWPWMATAALWLAALACPPMLRPVHTAWTTLGEALGWVNTRIVLTLLFALSIVPVGLLMRALGRDPMERRRDPERESYRRPSRKRPAKGMERPF